MGSTILQHFQGSVKVGGRVDANGWLGGEGGRDPDAVLKPSELLERLGNLERRAGHGGDALKHAGPIGIEPHMGVERGGRDPLLPGHRADVWYD